MGEVEVIWAKKWVMPIVPVADCRHPGSEALSINQRLEPTKRGQHRIVMDASICMNCGADATRQVSLRDGLILCEQEHGWHLETRERLYDLVASHEKELWETSEELPVWFAYAWGWEWPRIKAALESNLARRAA